MDVNADPENHWLYPPLMAAAFGGQEETIRLLIDQGVDLNTRTVGNGENAMHFAALGGHASLVQFFLKMGVDSEVTNNDGDTPLLWAAGAGHADVTKLLLTQGVEINITDRLGRVPLIWATARGHYHVVKELLQSEDLYLNAEDGDAGTNDVTPLAIAAEMGRERIFQMLFAHPKTNRKVHVLFYCALIGGRASIVRTVIAEFPGTLENFERIVGQTVLMRAAEQGSEEVVRYLLTLDEILINYQDLKGLTALHMAVESGDTGKFIALREHPELTVAPISHVDNCAKSALDRAARKSPLDTRTVEALLEHPQIDPNVRDQFGRTPLASATINGHARMVKLLLARDGEAPSGAG